MKRFIIALGVALALFLSQPLYAQQGVIEIEPLDLIIPNVITSSISLFSRSDQGWHSCSGVVIKNTPTESIVLTAKHCSTMKTDIWVEGLEVESMGVALYDDLAYLILDQFIPYKTPAKLSNYIPVKDDLIAFVGYPNKNLYISKGTMFLETNDKYMIDGKIIRGCSGGGAFNTDGELIGIITNHIPLFNTIFVEKLQDIHKFVHMNQLLEE